MGLRKYHQKRHFDRTPEPRGRESSRASGHSFVIQKHAASHLHYDFRLEMEGVLKSWAIPKGPSLDPKQKRLAVQVEDHPLDYGGFEGTIPEGQYGGGTVMLWDRGEWIAEGDAKSDYEKGRLRFHLEGEKLHGGWTLVRMAGQSKNWLLVKQNDDAARTGKESEIADEPGHSVASGRTMEEIAGKPKPAPAPKPARAARPRAPKAADKPPTRSSTVSVMGVRLTHPERILYPSQGATKLALARYYEAVSSLMIPYVTNRFLTLVRCPSGIHKDCFLQRHMKTSLSPYLHTVQVPEKKRSTSNLTLDSPQALIALAQMGVLEIHSWGSPASAPDAPDRLVFDLDPDPTVAWEQVVEAAHALGRRLRELGLSPFVKTSGGKGLHIFVPLKPGEQSWEEVEAFSRALAEAFAKESPELYLATMSKEKRTGKIFIDYLRNTRAASTVAPYSTRSRPGAPVSAPLAWEELTPQIGPASFTIENMPERLASQKRDPWHTFDTSRAKLTRQMLQALK